MATRRRFLKIATQGVACAACAGSVVACGGGEDAPPLEEDVVLTLADYPDLQTEGGEVELSSEVTGYELPIFVRNEGNDEFIALGAFCNHQGCAVMPDSDGYKCPCHGARFAADGTLREGPATADLVRFDVGTDGTTITILAG